MKYLSILLVAMYMYNKPHTEAKYAYSDNLSKIYTQNIDIK
ncbi:MAG: hypothetical protein ACRCX2_06720 [Paraclostridium sp.]